MRPPCCGYQFAGRCGAIPACSPSPIRALPLHVCTRMPGQADLPCPTTSLVLPHLRCSMYTCRVPRCSLVHHALLPERDRSFRTNQRPLVHGAGRYSAHCAADAGCSWSLLALGCQVPGCMRKVSYRLPNSLTLLGLMRGCGTVSLNGEPLPRPACHSGPSPLAAYLLIIGSWKRGQHPRDPPVSRARPPSGSPPPAASAAGWLQSSIERSEGERSRQQRLPGLPAPGGRHTKLLALRSPPPPRQRCPDRCATQVERPSSKRERGPADPSNPGGCGPASAGAPTGQGVVLAPSHGCCPLSLPLLAGCPPLPTATSPRH